MSEPVAVTKMHGACNDFVVLDARAGNVPPLRDFAVRVCDRRTGIGADGLIVLEPSSTAGVRMRVINADGSEAEMCGNGIRCAARWLDEAGEGSRVAFETGAGIVRTEISAREPEYLVRVQMPTPAVAEEGVASLAGVTVVDVGNPHAVIFVDDVDGVELKMLAESLQQHSRFPNGTNVHVAAVAGETLRVRHWERGVGVTQACGTGAVACAAAAIRRGVLPSPVDVLVPGGRLSVEWDGSGAAWLAGPAVRVFDTVLAAEPAFAAR